MSHICLEGVNGVGKTTIIKRLEQKGYKTLSSPNGTPLAKYLRPACRGTDCWNDLSDMVKFLLFSAARCDEYDKLVKDKHNTVICDRWHFSTWTYQCQLGDISEQLYKLTIHPDEEVDMVIILTGDPKVLAKRVKDERLKNTDHKKCSWTQNLETMKRIGHIYKNKLPPYLEKQNIKYHIIDTTVLTIDQVENEVQNLIDSLEISIDKKR